MIKTKSIYMWVEDGETFYHNKKKYTKSNYTQSGYSRYGKGTFSNGDEVYVRLPTKYILFVIVNFIFYPFKLEEGWPIHWEMPVIILVPMLLILALMFMPMEYQVELINWLSK